MAKQLMTQLGSVDFMSVNTELTLCAFGFEHSHYALVEIRVKESWNLLHVATMHHSDLNLKNIFAKWN